STVNNGLLIAAHLRGTTLMPKRPRCATDKVVQLATGQISGHDFTFDEAAERGRVPDLAAQLDAAARSHQVFGIGQCVGVNTNRVARGGSGKPHPTAALGMSNGRKQRPSGAR